MKSCEYVNTLNGLIYWLEDGAVMMRRDGENIARQSNMTAKIFFAMVGNDTLILGAGASCACNVRLQHGHEDYQH